MSTTEYVIVTSAAPTYGRVSPEASVETISFGTPTGSTRIACAAIEELPDPPTERIPSSRPSSCRRPNDLRRTPPHRVDCRTPVLRGRERRRVRACGRRYLLA